MIWDKVACSIDIHPHAGGCTSAAITANLLYKLLNYCREDPLVALYGGLGLVTISPQGHGTRSLSRSQEEPKETPVPAEIQPHGCGLAGATHGHLLSAGGDTRLPLATWLLMLLVTFWLHLGGRGWPSSQLVLVMGHTGLSPCAPGGWGGTWGAWGPLSQVSARTYHPYRAARPYPGHGPSPDPGNISQGSPMGCRETVLWPPSVGT